MSDKSVKHEHTVTDLKKQLRDANAEIAEDREIKSRMREEIEQAQSEASDWKRAAESMVESLNQEKQDLFARILRIDQRLVALGYTPPQTPSR
jgi:chromosome segregation ATPase